jgi:small subunit ribosomal protein S24e
MELKIESSKENALMGRKEIVFTLRHEGATTPSRVQVRQLVAGEVGTKTENVVIDSMRTEYGLGATRGTARAYKSAEEARKLERIHFLKRNQLYVEKAKKGEKKEA